MKNIWIVDDKFADRRNCEAVLEKLGLTARHFNSVKSAINELQRCEEENEAPPQLIVLDLSFPNESGFEVLREWRSSKSFEKVKIIVWTVMGETERQICKHFGVEDVVPKWAGAAALEESILRASENSRSTSSHG